VFGNGTARSESSNFGFFDPPFKDGFVDNDRMPTSRSTKRFERAFRSPIDDNLSRCDNCDLVEDIAIVGKGFKKRSPRRATRLLTDHHPACRVDEAMIDRHQSAKSIETLGVDCVVERNHNVHLRVLHAQRW
jgi:hypothetical protein